VAGHRASGHLGGALDNRRDIGDLAASVGALRPRPARLTQRRQPLAPQGSTGQHVEPRIEGLGRAMLAHVVRIRMSETSGNLFGRAALPQLGLDRLPQPGIQEFPLPPGLTRSGGGQGLRRAGAIGAAPRGVASRLAAEGAGGTP
jgi:hypothetical protein